MKCFNKLICFAAAFGLLALTAPAVLADDSLESIQDAGQKQCDSLKASLKIYTDNFNKLDSYPGLAANNSIDVTTVHNGNRYACTINAQKPQIKTAIGTVSTVLNGHCDNLVNATTIDEARTISIQIATINRDIMPIIQTVSKVEAYSIGYGNLSKTINIIYAFINHTELTNSSNKVFVTAANSNPALNDQKKYIWGTAGDNGSFLEEIAQEAVGTQGTDYCQLTPVYSTLFTVPTNFSGFKDDLKTKSSEVDTLNGNARGNLARAMNAIMAEAAKAGYVLSVPAEPKPQYYIDYNQLLDRYNTQRDSLRTTLDKRIEKEMASLAAYLPKLINIKYVGNLSASVTTTLKSNLEREINYGLLQAVRLDFVSSTKSFNLASATAAQINNLNVKGIILKNIDLAIKFNKSAGTTIDLNGTCNRFKTSYTILLDGLQANSNDKTTLISLRNSFDSICPDVTTLYASKMTQLEDKIKSNAVAGVSKANIDELVSMLKSYDKTQSDASKKIGQYRSQWWKLINQAAIEGLIIAADLQSSGLVDEQKASKTFADYEKKKDGYRATAKKIIDSRNDVLNKNLSLMLSANSIAEVIKTKLKTAINILVGTGSGSLDEYYNTEILAQNNYLDLKTAVDFIKSGFKLNEVVIPLQAQYLKLDKYYADNFALYSVWTNLKPRYDRLSETAKTEQMKKLAADIAADLSFLYNNSLKNMNDTMAEALEDLDESKVDTVKDQGSAIKKMISTVKSNETRLLPLITAAEKKAAQTAP